VRETFTHGLIYGIGQTLASAAGFLLIPLYTNYLNSAEYGVLTLLTTTATVLTAIFVLGLNSALFRSYYDYDDAGQRGVVVSTSLVLLILSDLTFISLGTLFSQQLSQLILGSPEYAPYLVLALWTAGMAILQTIPFAIFRAERRSIQYSVVNIVMLVVRLGLIIYLVAAAHQGVWGVVQGNLWASVLSTAVLFWMIRHSLRPAFSQVEARKMFAYGLPLVVVNLTGQVMFMSDRYFLRAFSDLSEVGIYNLSNQFGSLVMILIGAPLKLIWPPMMFAVEKEEYAADFYARILTYFTYLSLFICLGISLLADNLLRWMSKPEFWPAAQIVPIICLSYALFNALDIVNPGVALRRRTQLNAIAFVVGAAANLALNFLLIPPFGRQGAAWATLITFILLFVLKYRLGRDLFVVKYEWGRLVKLLLVAGGLFLLGSLVPAHQTLLSIVLRTLIALTFPFVLFPLRFYERSELQTGLGFLASRLKRIRERGTPREVQP